MALRSLLATRLHFLIFSRGKFPRIGWHRNACCRLEDHAHQDFWLLIHCPKVLCEKLRQCLTKEARQREIRSEQSTSRNSPESESLRTASHKAFAAGIHTTDRSLFHTPCAQACTDMDELKLHLKYLNLVKESVLWQCAHAATYKIQYVNMQYHAQTFRVKK